jgi:endonuclease/exonuclease/phosphatase family metal-dependent hydrolase
VRVITYNIREGGKNYLQEIGTVLEQAKPDIVALQEANDEYVFESLTDRLGFKSILGVGNHGYHVGVLTRYPILKWHNHAGKGEFFHTLLEVDLLTPVGEVAIFATHLDPGYSPVNERHRLEEVEAILNYMELKKGNRCILLGDFNGLSPQDNLKLEDWPLNWRIQVLARGGEIGREALQAVLNAGLIDCYRINFPDNVANPGYTLPAPRPNVRLDYIFANELLIKQLQSCRVWSEEPAPQASDHLPVLAEFADLD